MSNINDRGPKQPPVFSKRYSAGNGDIVQLSIFEFRNGKEQWLSHSLRITRSFRKGGSGSEWKNTDYLSPECALVAAHLFAEGFAWVQERRDAEYRARRGDQQVHGNVFTAGVDFSNDVPF